MAPQRQAGKYGRLPLDPARPRLTLEKYLDPRAALHRGGLPPVPLSRDVDRASEVSSWPMYLNDQLGDCTIAGLAHMFGAWTRYAGGGEALFTDDEVQKAYSRVGGYVPGQPDTDQGCVMVDVLADAKANGMTDTGGKVHKVAGYAALGNPADEELLGQVLDVFGSVYVGINVQQQMEDEFSQGRPWTWKRGAEVIGGHAICLQRRRGSGPARLEYVTWGALQPATFSFQAHAAEEAWAVVTEDWISANGTTVEGLDLQQLLADMEYV
jgi:hypothetical protein